MSTEPIEKIFTLDIPYIIMGIFFILCAIIAMCVIIGKFAEYIGKPIKFFQRNNNDHELLLKTIENVNALQERHKIDTENSIKHDEIIQNDLEKLTNMFIDKKIDDYRWEIINFSTKVSEGKPCNKDSYKHCLKTYEKYEKLLEENNLENGEVEISMEIINESYKKKMLEGF